MGAPRAVIDADNLYRRHTRNLLVWHALEGMFEPCWSTHILAETRKNLIANAAIEGPEAELKTDQILDRVTQALTISGAGLQVADADIAQIEDEMTNDPKDRHVLAAAVAASATVIITDNSKDFPERSLAPFSVRALTADEFLSELLQPTTADIARAALNQQASFHGWTLPDLLALLGHISSERRPIAPNYVSKIEDHLGIARAPTSPESQ